MSDGVPAGWYPDPKWRHQHRYWDGSKWTEHVADQGRQALDPVSASQPVEVTPSNDQAKKPPGLFERRRQKKASAKYEQALAAWEQKRDGQLAAIALARGEKGESSSELMLKRGEALFAKITGVGLIEMRKGPGQWQGRSQGVSIPVGSFGGRSIRYRTGGSRGHYVQGTPHPTAIDTGNVFITNQRIVFQGQSQTRECLFTKLLSREYEPGSTTFSVSNRQKPTTIHYGSQLDDWVQLRLEIALAHYRDEVSALVDRLEQGLAAIDAEKPSAPLTS